MADQSRDNPGASGELPHWWANVPKPLQHGTGEYQPPGYPTTTSPGVPTRFVPGPLNSGQLNQALDELQGQIAGFVAEAPQDGAVYGRSNAAWSQALPVTALGTTVPAMDGVGAAGSASTVAREDHVHPTDTSRAAASAIPAASSTAPAMDGTATAGSATAYARGDHVHPTDSSRAPLASPTFTGIPAAPTASPGTNTTQLASTAFVGAAVVAAGGAAPSNANPAMNGTAAPGTSALYARGDHVHPSDTSRAPLASPVFTGDARAVTPAAGDNDTSIATTAFVAAAVQPVANNVGRNVLHNPLFNIQQRGAGPWTTGMTADRWGLWSINDTVSYSLAALSDADRTAIGDEAATYAFQNVFTGSATAGSVTSAYHHIESVRRLGGKQLTLSFWARATSGTPRLNSAWAQSFGSGGSPSAGVTTNAGTTASLTSTWTRYTLTATLPSTSGKTLGTTAGTDFTEIKFVYSEVGGVGQQSGTVQLWGVQLEIGSVATPLEKPDPQQDLAKCQRFYQTGSIYIRGYNIAGGAIISMYSFPVQMRAVPTTAVALLTQSNTNGPIVAGGVAANGFAPGAVVTATGDAYVNMTFTASADL